MTHPHIYDMFYNDICCVTIYKRYKKKYTEVKNA